MRRRRQSWTTLAVFVVLWLTVFVMAAAACGRSSFDGFVRSGETASMVDPVQGGCDQVDFLFVIDNSASMGDKQSILAGSVPGFVDGLKDVLGSLLSVHVGVTTTDAYAPNVESCAVSGGLIVRTGGPSSSLRSCGPYAEGGAYITGADPLAEAFECAVSVGTAGGTHERPLHAIRRALSDSLLAPGACNEGFIRDDALLVLVIVSDEDAHSDPEKIYEAVLDRKRGFDDNVVVVSLVNDEAGPCTPTGHSSYAPDLVAFTRSFEHGFIGPVCAESYEPTFRQAIDVVQAACGA